MNWLSFFLGLCAYVLGMSLYWLSKYAFCDCYQWSAEHNLVPVFPHEDLINIPEWRCRCGRKYVEWRELRHWPEVPPPLGAIT